MNWSDDDRELQKQVSQAFDELGFEWPENEEQLKALDEKFKGYPHKTNIMNVDPDKIIESLKRKRK